MAFPAVLEPKSRSPRSLEDFGVHNSCTTEVPASISMAAVMASGSGRYSLRGGIAWSVDSRCRDARFCLRLQAALPQLGELTASLPRPDEAWSMPAALNFSNIFELT